ncbi:unnamed protein product [Alternaria burnsii]|nr:unnamed protein product [Alternaria burnsii]
MKNSFTDTGIESPSVSVAEWLWRVTQAKACLLWKTHSQEVSHRATCVGSNPTADSILFACFCVFSNSRTRCDTVCLKQSSLFAHEDFRNVPSYLA